MNYSSMIAPTKYFQGRNILEQLCDRTCHLGKRYALLVDEIIYEIVKDKIEKAFCEKNVDFTYIFFQGESTLAEANRIAECLKESNREIIVGLGGGKIIDSAKLAAKLCENMKTVIVPTSASSDAPCTANTVIYDEHGRFLNAEKTNTNPDVVLVDTDIILNAPARMLIAGMGDAFVTYYEARASKRAGLFNLSGGMSTVAGYEIARLSRDILLKHGKKAKEDVERSLWSEDFEAVVEANIYLSGVGFENNGCSIAHGAYNGLTIFNPDVHIMHGEGVAFGLLLQLAIEYEEYKVWDDDEWNTVIEFYNTVNLPTSFEDIKIVDTSTVAIKQLAKTIFEGSANVFRVNFEVTQEKIEKGLMKVRDMKIC